MSDSFTSPFGSLKLKRLPKGDRSLRAWDAADEFLLNHVQQNNLLLSSSTIAIVNDSFGVLALALKGINRDSIGDSYLSHLATEKNAEFNQIELAHDGYRPLRSFENTEATYSIAMVKVPKSLALLEDQLYQLKQRLAPEARVVAGGMTRSIHNSTIELFERIIGPTKTSLAKKKARLIFSENREESEKKIHFNDYIQNRKITHYSLEGSDILLRNYPGVFSRAKLDIGTRFFLPHIQTYENSFSQILDLGCGNGALGLMAAYRNPEVQVTFVDESYQAIESVKLGIKYWSQAGDEKRFTLRIGHILNGIPKQTFDRVLCNPPFHQNNSIGKQTAFLMFEQARQVLKKSGVLQIVANRHLNYQHKLKKLFGNCQLIDSNQKFVILQALKT